MSEYWKSHPKKFCDICNCWIADNKPSIAYHEQGKKHKEYFAQHLKEMSRSSSKDQKETIKIGIELKKMEEEAMKAYKKDVEANAGHTSQMLNKELDAERNAQESTSSIDNSVGSSKKHKESVWEPPTDGYVSLADQEGKEKTETETRSRSKGKEPPKKKDREVNKKRGELISEEQGTSSKRTKVEDKEQKTYDLEQHQSKLVVLKALASKRSEPEIKFKEVVAGTVQGSDPHFRKRKLSSSVKTNRRRRTEDD